MRPVEGTIAAADGTELFTRSWRPDGEARAVVMVSHGFGEHSGRYAALARDLVDRGLVVHALDHRGHGRSGGRRGYVDGFSDFADDLDLFHRSRVGQEADRPWFLLGHSMGATISLVYATQHQEALDGLILSGVFVSPSTAVPGAAIRAAGLLGRITPTVGTTRLDAGAISRDPDVVAAYEADPLVYHGRVPARTAAEMLRVGRALPETARQLSLPVLLVHGGADALTSPEGSRQLRDAVASSDVTLEIYPSLYHEVLNEPERDQVVADVVAWIEARAGSEP